MCCERENQLRQKKRRSTPARDKTVLSISTDSLSVTAEETCVAPSPFLPLLSTSLNEMGAIAISAKERQDVSTAHFEARTVTFSRPKHKPSSPRVSARCSATRASPIAYLPSNLYTIVYCLYTRLPVGSGSLTPSSKSFQCLLLFLSRATPFIPRAEFLFASAIYISIKASS
jgi:hypothetical protein